MKRRRHTPEQIVTPVLATEDSEQRIYEGMRDYAGRLAEGDVTLLDEDEGAGGAAFAGEHYRAIYRCAVREGEPDRVSALPWGIGAAIARTSAELDEPAVFFACRTHSGGRTFSGSTGCPNHNSGAACRLRGMSDLAELVERLASSESLSHGVEEATRPGRGATGRWMLLAGTGETSMR